MKTFTKLTVAALAIATLAGCAAPLPKGSDSSKYLPLPVNTANMKPVEMKLKAKNGDEYDALRFHDVANNKWYDSDGYPVNDKFLRVRKDGVTCVVTSTAMIANSPNFEETPTGSREDLQACLESKNIDKSVNSARILSGGLILVGGPVVAAFGAAGAAQGAIVDALEEKPE
jgi:hypothetical protein